MDRYWTVIGHDIGHDIGQVLDCYWTVIGHDIGQVLENNQKYSEEKIEKILKMPKKGLYLKVLP